MRIFLRFLELVGVATLHVAEWIGQLTEYIVRAIARWARQTCFGNWRRTGVTLVIIGLVATHYQPNLAGPLVAPLMAIALVCCGIYIMAAPLRQLLGPPRRRRRRRRH
jgi:hypothetical protein